MLGSILLANVSPVAYWAAVGVTAALCVGVVLLGRRHRGRWLSVVAKVVGFLLLADAVSFVVAEVRAGTFSAGSDLPLALCDMAVLVAAAACWSESPLLVEITWFWGLAGTLQGLLTPDLNVGFPHLVFWQYVVGHGGIVLAAVLLVGGMGIHPRKRAAPRVLAITVAYTALVGAIDGIFGANYMFLRQPPPEWTLLRVLGPWPWYTVSALGVAIVLLTVLDAPFWAERRAAASPSSDRAVVEMRRSPRPAHH